MGWGGWGRVIGVWLVIIWVCRLGCGRLGGLWGMMGSVLWNGWSRDG